MFERTIVILFLILLLNPNSEADEYHNINLLNGSKATGLGGAFISVADDLTAMLYNPAGLSFSEINSTASVNVLSWEKTDFTEVFSDGSDFDRESFTVVPGYFAFRQKKDNWDYGISFAVTDFGKERTSTDVIIDVPQNGLTPPQQNNEFIYIDLDNSAYKFGASSAYRVSDNLSFGASLYFQYKEFTTVQGSGIATTVFTPFGNLEGGFNASRRITDLQMSLQPILGVLWQKDNFSIGGKLAYEIPVKRDYEATASIFLSSIEALPPQVQAVTRVTEKTDKKQKLPFEASIGLSYQFQKLLISGDINYYSKVSAGDEILDVIATPTTRALNKVVNYSLGIEYSVSQDTSVRFGLFTDNSNGDINTNIDNQRIEDIDMFGLSSSVETSFIGRQLTFGLYYKQGTGNVRYADIRSVENIVGLPLYPDDGSSDIAEAKKKALVLFLSMDF